MQKVEGLNPIAGDLFTGEYGLHYEVINYKLLFDQLPQQPIILNDIDVSDKEGRERLNDLIITKYEGDTLVNTPRCAGGHLMGERFKGALCELCNTRVEYVTERPLESLVWFVAPEPVPAFMNLTVWVILRKVMTVSGFSILDWLCNEHYQPDVQWPPIMDKVEAAGFQRGLTAFVQNYDEYLLKLVELRVIPSKRRRTVVNGVSIMEQHSRVYQFLQENRANTFSEVLPFPSSLIFVLEKTGSKAWADHTMRPAMEAVYTLAGIANRVKSLSRSRIEQCCVVVMNRLVEFYNDYCSKLIFGKPGIYRKLVFGTRPPWTFRAVITSVHKPHRYDELEFPWSLSVALLRQHIVNRLFKRGYTPQEALALLAENSMRYNPLIRKIFDEILYDGSMPLYTTWQRFPSLRRQSNERKKIGTIKDDPTDNTIGTSTLCLTGKNALK